ncbi:klarsicht protein [Anthonomus grandis grandis]|uniref:klarsicht protein n=1 Tax=Anthonomus grandis grandis TaxID=2921223 RepID=UPI00216522F4|nr:klarsicht protein [Anthonomus grandis grandis]XP_050314652.1 klarsicht protein [Anthonomus grandis grandis]
MPVGVNLVNSSLKNSFSLSSLQQTPSENTPEKTTVKQRQFNSLTKNRVKATAVRRSWGSTASDHREEFWSALQANYNYIMDNNLIDKCQEVNGDLASHTGTWTLREFYAQFSELYSWLNSVQETIYGKEENITDKALRARCVNKVLEKSSSLKIFNDQASQLVHLYPEVQEEVGWRTTHLNSKWDSILSILGPSDCEMCDQDTCLDIDHELKCLRSWFKIMESCLQPLDFRAKYTKTEIETKALELNVLHRDIENHGKIVGSVVKLCKRPDAKCNTANARRIANGLERRWHLLFLRSLEWQCYLESLSKRQNFKNSATSSDESDSDCYREPVSKYPRLSGKEPHRRNCNSQPEDCDSSEEDDACSVESNEAVMSDTSVLETYEEIDVVDGASSIGVDSSQFTQSNKKAPNLATYYFKHEDTDSDMDRIESFSLPRTDGQTSTLDETSEEEWTYTRTEPAHVPDSIMEIDVTLRAEDVEEQIVPKAKAMSEDQIRMLVQKAEELVSPDKCRKPERSNSLKISRVNKWLSLEKPDDSCDASAEEDERESQTSEEIDASTMTLRDSHNTLFPEGSRNWCGSYGSRLDVPSANASGINFLSISESALHKMTLSPKTLDRFCLSTNSFNINGNHSTSSTVEEISPLVTEKTSPMRRKKSKSKKKALFGKSDPRLLYSPGTIKHRNMLIKSGSFSGYSLQRSEHERHSTSDPSAVHHCAHLWCEVSTTSGADSDDDSRKRMPNNKSGSKQQYPYGSEMREESPGKFSLNATESSSLSEAWDNYQEPYLSEPYSESHDSDAARRLLNFGEDYRNFIDSQSDWSALSDVSPKFKRKVFVQQQAAEESNSDEESLKQLINDSREQLKYAQDVFEHVKEGISSVTNEIEQLVSNCDSHIALLSHITESSDEYKMSAGDKAVTTGLLSQWKTLRIRSVKMQEYRRLQKEISDLKSFITNLEVPENSSQLQGGGNPSEDINNEIEVCNTTLDLIKNHSSKLASINAAVHRFTLENQDFDDFSKCTLKAEVSELYELFDNAKTRISTKLSEIENLLPGWKMLESRLEQLQKDLLEDGKTLHLLDTVLTNGQFTDQTATCVRDVAKVLSESTSYQGYPLPEFFTEGSFSDSGISDEGSEHEIGERQGRLAAIRRLVRQLEIGLSPDSKARLIMREKLSAAEEELKALQQRCRNLIVRTAAVSQPVIEKISRKNKRAETKVAKSDGGDDDPGNDPEKTKWLKRLFKTSLAFQLVILTFVCISCWYEPQCCDYMNNYQWSVSPKLHYEGKPPI